MAPHKIPTLLITGGAGYIGSMLVKKALAEGYRVNILDNIDPEQDTLRDLFGQAGVRFIRGSITDPATVTECTKGVESVIHLAGVSDGRAGKINPELTRQVNTESMEQLLRISQAAGARRFIFASTFGVYGNQYRQSFHEDLPLNPVDPYSLSKAVGESLVHHANTPDFCAVSLRIAMVYGVGPRIREDFLLNKLCKTAAQTGALSIMGGAQQRPQVHIGDLTRIMLELLHTDAGKTGGKAFNVVGDNPSVSEMVSIILERLPGLLVEQLPSRAEEDSFEMNGLQLLQATGLAPLIDLKTGIIETINYYK